MSVNDQIAAATEELLGIVRDYYKDLNGFSANPRGMQHLLVLFHAYGLCPPQLKQHSASVHSNLDTAEKG